MNENFEKCQELLIASNRRMQSRVSEIAKLANDCLVNTVHPEGYVKGQIGNDYRTFGKTLYAIRKICGDPIADVMIDYDLIARQFFRPGFDRARLGQAIEALASEKPVDFPPPAPGRLPSGADGAEPSVPQGHAETAPGRAKGSMRSVKTGDHIEVVGYFDARRVVAEAEFAHPPCEDSPSPNVFGEGYVATVTRTDTDGTTKPVCKIDFANAGSVVCEKLLWCIVQCLKSYYGHRARNRANRHLRKISALSPSAELAATVARQQGDDDLAQRLENA